MRSQQVATLPRFRAGGGSVFAAQSRHAEPYPPMSKINPTLPLHYSFQGNAEKYIPFPRRFQAGNAVLEIVRGIVRAMVADVRRQDGGSPYGVTGRPRYHRSQQAATLPPAATSGSGDTSPATFQADLQACSQCHLQCHLQCHRAQGLTIATWFHFGSLRLA